MKTGFIIEDHPSAQQWLKEALLAAFPEIEVTIANTLEEAHALLDSGHPNIALVDLNLPDGSGVEVIERLNREAPLCTCVVTTIYDDDGHIFPALRAGAKGYILKEQRKEEIARLLQGIFNGEPPLSAAISQRMLSYFSSQQEAPAPNVVKHTLTQREQEVLSVIAKGYSLVDVANQLGVSRNTIATQVKSIYSKLNISSRAEAALAATQLGIIDR